MREDDSTNELAGSRKVRPRGSSWTIAAMAAVVLFALLGGTIFTLHAGTPTLAPTQVPHARAPVELAVYPDEQSAPACETSSLGVAISCPEAHFVCPRDAAWSPDDARVTLISSCPGRAPIDSRIFVYDTHSGKRLLDLSLLDTLKRLPNTPVPGRNTTLCTIGIPEAFPSIDAYSLLWSRDGARLEIPFTLTYRTHLMAAGWCYGWQGLLLVNPDGSAPRALYHSLVDSNVSSPPPGYPSGCYGVWDLATGSLVPLLLDTSLAEQMFDCLPPALAYAWGANGTLTPATLLPPADVPVPNSCPTSGNPNGDERISIWQAGAISRGEPPQPYQNTPPFYSWETYAFTGASPNGRYIVSTPTFLGLVDPAGQPLPDSAALTAAGWTSGPDESLPVLPVPGKVIEQQLAALPAAYSSGQVVAFRSDGRVVAMGGINVSSMNGQVQRISKPVALYDCASGRLLATLAPIQDNAYVDLTFPSMLLRWSPDGRYLLYADNAYGAATLWGPGSLPS